VQKIAGVKERSNTASLLFSHFNPINDLCNHHILFFQNLIIISMNTWYLLSVVQTPPWPPSPHYHGLQPRPVSPTSGWGHQGRQHHPQIRTRIINRTAGPPPSRSSTSLTPAWPSSYPGHTSRHPQLCYIHSQWVWTTQNIRKVQWNKKILIKTFHWPSINSKNKYDVHKDATGSSNRSFIKNNLTMY